jgi:hypothetical protein
MPQFKQRSPTDCACVRLHFVGHGLGFWEKFQEGLLSRQIRPFGFGEDSQGLPESRRAAKRREGEEMKFVFLLLLSRPSWNFFQKPSFDGPTKISRTLAPVSVQMAGQQERPVRVRVIRQSADFVCSDAVRRYLLYAPSTGSRQALTSTLRTTPPRPANVGILSHALALVRLAVPRKGPPCGW